MQEFSGKTAIVTGGAQGMGRQYVRLLGEAGANVVIADINEDIANVTLAELNFSDRAIFVKTDVGREDDAKACAAATLQKFGRIDYLINNAGLLSAAAHRSLIDVETETYLRIVNIMAHGMLWMARAVAPAMKAQGKGGILNVSSIGSWQATGVYSIAKATVNALTINLAHELAMHNIRVNAVAPGTVNTEGMHPLMSVEQMAQWGQMGGRPTDRVAAPEEIARAGLFLLSDAASYIRGQILPVDDGQTIRL